LTDGDSGLKVAIDLNDGNGNQRVTRQRWRG
jgi:hypothetical protein